MAQDIDVPVTADEPQEIIISEEITEETTDISDKTDENEQQPTEDIGNEVTTIDEEIIVNHAESVDFTETDENENSEPIENEDKTDTDDVF